MDNLDYIRFYADKIKENPKYFAQQKMIIESQMKASSSLFRNMFKGKDFKVEARKYLRKIGLI